MNLTEPKESTFTQDPSKIKYLTPVQVQSLLTTVKKVGSARDYAIMMVSYYHGLRISEVGKLQISDYIEETDRIQIRRGKGGLSYTYLLHPECIAALKRWIIVRGKGTGPLFPSRRTRLGEDGLGVSKRQLHTLFKGYSIKARIPEEWQHFHVLRHSIAVHMVDKMIPLIQIKDWLGHRSIQSTEVYAKVSDLARNQTAEILYGTGVTVVFDPKKDKGKGEKVNWKKDKRK
jgi:integrase